MRAVSGKQQEAGQVKRAEEVTFGGGGLDRAAHIRGDAAALAAAWDDPAAGVLLFWRGKPLVRRGAEGAPLGLADRRLPACPGRRCFWARTGAAGRCLRRP